MRFLTALLVLAAAGCTANSIVDTGDPPPRTETTVAAPATSVASNAHLVDASGYVFHVGDEAGYYFTTPSGRWRCAILTRVKAGCQSAGGSGLGIVGEPATVPDVAGEPVRPNAIVVGRTGDAQFAALDSPEFTPSTGPAKTLLFNRILAAAGFRCNVQESGVSCLSESSGQGFAFSSEGFTPRYADVPADAP